MQFTWIWWIDMSVLHSLTYFNQYNLTVKDLLQRMQQHEFQINLIIFTSLSYAFLIMTIHERVEQALDTIRPYLEKDGGNVKIEEITDGNVVKLKLLGTCASCAMSIMTFKAGLEQAIKKAVPEIVAVEALNLTDMNDPNAITPGGM